MALVSFLLGILIILLLVVKNTLESKFNTLLLRLDRIQNEIERLKGQMAKDIGVVAEKVQEEQKSDLGSVKVAAKAEDSPKRQKELQPAAVLREPKKTAPKVPVAKSKSFWEKHPDLEKFIGENLMNKIGIAILIVGVAIFVKYAIDRDWIGPAGRVLIGVLCGGVLIGVAHRLHKGYKAFSSVLLGGGIAILYVSIALAFHLFGLISQPLAFVLMMVITAFTVGFSLLYNRMEIAVLAILGGFGSPFMVSTGEGNPVILFSYILLLNSGMLVLAWFRKWYPINIICYAMTVLLFGGWFLSQVVGEANPAVGVALVFASLFFIVFLLMNVVYELKHQRRFKALDYSIILSVTCLYFFTGLHCVNVLSNGLFNGLFTALLALFFFVCAWFLYRSKKVDLNMIYLFIGLILTFLSLAAPIQLEGHNITLFWGAEAVLLLWLAGKSGIKVLKKGSVVVLALMLVSLLMDFNNVYLGAKLGYAPSRVLLNKGFLTGVYALLSVFLYLKLVYQENEKQFLGFPLAQVKKALIIVFSILVYLTGFLEISYQLHAFLHPYYYNVLVICTFSIIYSIAVYFVSAKKAFAFLKPAAFVLSLLCTLAYVIFVHKGVVSLRNSSIVDELSMWYFWAHALTIGLICWSLVLNWSLAKLYVGKGEGAGTLSYPIFSLLVVLFLVSSELDHLVVLAYANDLSFISQALDISHKAGYPVVWGLYSFVLMIVGMKKRIKYLRFASLALFSVTLLKLFLYDIRNASEGGKIGAFVSLGVLLLIVSFMYQKLKSMLVNTDPKK
ncbi:DUF2339 domain-containing protein [Cytophagaceae bacterium ABcell3]|nr:DUF2339 domain-containing protein [Cytophagaceae bacterium ABcell3]